MKKERVGRNKEGVLRIRDSRGREGDGGEVLAGNEKCGTGSFLDGCDF